MGGIAGTEGALEFLMAGAAAVQVGSATFAHPTVMAEIIDGIAGYMARRGIGRVRDLAIREKYGEA
jgi:dihydroorotate dehydrogenase (NAD+) catalytic subunit